MHFKFQSCTTENLKCFVYSGCTASCLLGLLTLTRQSPIRQYGQQSWNEQHVKKKKDHSSVTRAARSFKNKTNVLVVDNKMDQLWKQSWKTESCSAFSQYDHMLILALPAPRSRSRRCRRCWSVPLDSGRLSHGSPGLWLLGERGWLVRLMMHHWQHYKTWESSDSNPAIQWEVVQKPRYIWKKRYSKVKKTCLKVVSKWFQEETITRLL